MNDDNKRSKIENIVRLYNEEKYIEALQSILEFKSNGGTSIEVESISAKITLELIDPFKTKKDDKMQVALLNTLTEVTKQMNSADEFCDFWTDFDNEHYSWKNRLVQSAIAEMEKHQLSFSSLAAFQNLMLGLLLLELDLNSILCALPSADWQESKRVGEYSDYRVQRIDEFLDEAYEKIFLLTKKIETAFRTEIEGLGCVNINYFEDIYPTFIKKAGEIIVTKEYCISQMAKDSKKSRAFKNKVRQYADFVIYSLDKKFCFTSPNCLVGEISLFIDEDLRKEYIEKLKRVYDFLSKEDNSFIPFVLPDEKPVMPQERGDQTGGCYIATAVYGSYDCPEVWTLRRFRDYRLAKTFLGRAFVRFYYFLSPHLVKHFGQRNWFNRLFRPMLDTMVKRLNAEGLASTPYTDKEW